MKIYLDMDGTLVDFVSQVNKCGFWRTDKENKVDWKKVKAIGPHFWSEMDWMPGAEYFFYELNAYAKEGYFEIYILSSIDFQQGIDGKEQWIKEHTDFPLEKVIFVTAPEDKEQYATPDAFLIDDRKKSLEPFAKAGGNAIEFTGDWNYIKKELNKSLLLRKKLLLRNATYAKDMDISDNYLRIVHKFSLKNMDSLRNDSICGCFYCLEIFSPKEIKEVVEESDGKETALCPCCGIDAVIGDSSGFSISKQFLSKMFMLYF